MKYWINTISKDHVLRGVEGGFTQANHGKPTTLRRLHQNDWMLFYSSLETYQSKDRLQAFTALGQVIDAEPFQNIVSDTFQPWRRLMRFVPVTETPIRPLLDSLTFISDKSHWGYKFRLGLFEIPEEDFKRIVSVMLNADNKVKEGLL